MRQVPDGRGVASRTKVSAAVYIPHPAATHKQLEIPAYA